MNLLFPCMIGVRLALETSVWTSYYKKETSPPSADEIDLTMDITDLWGEVLYGSALNPRYFPPDAALMTLNQTLFPSSTTFMITGPELNFVALQKIEPPTWFS